MSHHVSSMHHIHAYNDIEIQNSMLKWFSPTIQTFILQTKGNGWLQLKPYMKSAYQPIENISRKFEIGWENFEREVNGLG